MPQSLIRRILRLVLRLFYKPFLGPPLPLSFQRGYLPIAAKAAPGPKDSQVERAGVFEVPTYRIGAGSAGAPARVPAILWAHGGGFVVGDRRSHGGFLGHIAVAAGAEIYMPEYRLAPEHPYPAATDDIFSVYRAMLDRGHDPAKVALGGDSAGGTLAILTALAIGEMGLPAPAALVLCSPVTDLALTGASVSSRARVDPMLRREFLESGYRAFAGPLALTDPRISPLFADLQGLPPTLIQVGEDEILLDDSLRFADRAWGAGAEVELQRFPGLWHDFQANATLLEEAAGAVDDIGGFLRRRWHL